MKTAYRIMSQIACLRGKRYRRVLCLLYLLTALLPVKAQLVDILTQAQTAYNNGRFEQVDSILQHQLRTFKSQQNKISAYKLLALSALCQDKTTVADEYVQELLNVDPYYTPYDEPQRFIDLINSHKQRDAGITTASRKAESLSEAPVPVTLITEDMIRHSGCQTLQELLTLYVPGMTNSDGMESNIAMHGIYGISQNKILFLQDGHRLNGGSTQTEAPDFRNSLDKIQQIEVLRGAASSLYGSVALTAVVNIITRKGAGLNGGRVTGTIGTQRTYGGSYVVGGGNNVVDIMGWGSINQTDGFKHVVDNGLSGENNSSTTLYSHGFRDRPSYDIGIKGRWKDFILTFNSQRAKQCPYINILQLPATQYLAEDNRLYPQAPVYDAYRNFNYDNYSSYMSNKPGTTRTNHHLNLDYSHRFGPIDLSASAYMSMESSSIYNAMGDSIDSNLASYLLMVMYKANSYEDMDMTSFISVMSPWTHNVYQYLDWQNFTVGGQLQASTDYQHFLGHGTGMLGVQYEHFTLTNGDVSMGGETTPRQTTKLDYTVPDLISKGSENLVGIFGQVKHYLSGERFIINAGLRYDHKHRFNGANLDRISPRVSLIYKLNQEYSFLASYNYSLVDAPYLYRASNVTFFGGDKDMSPETMSAIQIGANFRRPSKGLQADLSIFYNMLDNLVSINNPMKNSGTTLFTNAGVVKQIGVDGSFQFTRDRLFLNATASWQRILSFVKFKVHKHLTLGTPEFSLNVNAAWAAYKGAGTGFFGSGKVWLRGQVRMQSKTYYQSTDYILTYATSELTAQMKEEPMQCIPSVGVGYEWKYLDLDFSLKNIFNSRYLVGSFLNDGVPYDGRQFLFKLTVKF